MHDLGIDTGVGLKQRTLAELVQQFGKGGIFFYGIARGEDDREVQANRLRKSLGAETSFAKDLADFDTMRQALESIAHTLQSRLKKHQSWGRTLTLKVKFGDYQQITRSRTLERSFQDLETIETLALELFGTIDVAHRSVRLLGLSMSNLDVAAGSDNYQLGLFTLMQV
jgi:DNA polymerase-4